MIRHIVLLYFPFVLALNSYSQNRMEKGSLSFSLGPSFPIGHYAANDISKSSSGFAKLGAAATVSYSRLFGKNFGVAACLMGQMNPLNTNALQTTFSQSKIYSPTVFVSSGEPNPTPPPSSQAGKVYPNWKFEKHSWMLGSLLAGGYGQFKLNQSGNIDFTTKALIGAAYVSAPKLSGSSITDTATAHIEQSSGTAFGLTYLISGGIQYKLNQKVFLLTQLEYLGSGTLTFKDITATFTSTWGSDPSTYGAAMQSSTGATKQIISSLNLSMGIGLRL